MKKLWFGYRNWLVMLGVMVFVWTTGCATPTDLPNPPEVNSPHKKGQTDFTTSDESGTQNGFGERGSTDGPSAGAAPGEANQDSSANKAAPSGRTGTVEEADLYRTFGNLLFYLNTYKGLTLFDLVDPKKPRKLYNLPVFGYPIEMFVEKNTVYALVRDALYLVRTNGKFEFHRRNVSQLVTIDITDPKQPKILQRFDIKGQLREGVSRKIDNTIYVVSYTPRYYYWGWYYDQPRANDQATVYSFNVANPQAVREVQSLDLIKDAPKPNTQQPDGSYESSSFNGVTISATSNALLVGEQWYYSRYKYNSNWRCNEYEYSQHTVLNVVNISDPNGKINLHTRFKVQGQLTDQFKQTYIYEEAKKRGIYLGIFQRQEWQRSGCNSQNLIKNTLVSVDISDGNNPKVLDELAFGKPNETVRGSVFDSDRGVAYAITAVQTDPLYAISFQDPANLKIMSEIDGLSGDINLFRFVENKKFLLAIGRDNSSGCEGFGSDVVGTNIAVSLIDVRDLNKIRLVQRRCVSIKGAKWSHSEINWNLDQAHKMIGQHAIGTTNLLTVPVSYYSQSEEGGSWWWYEYKSAIGIMKWDLSKYDDTKDHTQQNVMENVGTMIHPKGSVKRTIILELGDTNTKKRVVANLSDTHISLVDLNDLSKPEILSTLEIAPYIRSVYRFGDYIVERVNLGEYYDQYNEFRVKKNQFWRHQRHRRGGFLHGRSDPSSHAPRQLLVAVPWPAQIPRQRRKKISLLRLQSHRVVGVRSEQSDSTQKARFCGSTLWFLPILSLLLRDVDALRLQLLQQFVLCHDRPRYRQLLHQVRLQRTHRIVGVVVCGREQSRQTRIHQPNVGLVVLCLSYPQSNPIHGPCGTRRQPVLPSLPQIHRNISEKWRYLLPIPLLRTSLEFEQWYLERRRRSQHPRTTHSSYALRFNSPVLDP